MQVVANAKDVVVGAREAVTITVTGAKDTVAHTITGVMDKTKEAVHDSVEMTKSVVNGSINTVLGSRVVQMMSSGVDSALSRSETLVDHYLPLTEEELGKTEMRPQLGMGIGSGGEKWCHLTTLLVEWSGTVLTLVSDMALHHANHDAFPADKKAYEGKWLIQNEGVGFFVCLPYPDICWTAV